MQAQNYEDSITKEHIGTPLSRPISASLSLSLSFSVSACDSRTHTYTKHLSMEIEIMIMYPSVCIKVLPLQKKAVRHEMANVKLMD